MTIARSLRVRTRVRAHPPTGAHSELRASRQLQASAYDTDKESLLAALHSQCRELPVKQSAQSNAWVTHQLCDRAGSEPIPTATYKTGSCLACLPLLLL